MDLLQFGNQHPSTAKACIPSNWFISVDFQLYVFSFFLMKLMFDKPASGVKVGVLIIITAVGVQAAALHVYDYPISILLGGYEMEEIRKWIPWHTWATFNYVPCYVIGLFFGLATTRDIRIPEKFLPTIWFAGVQFYTGSVVYAVLLLSLPMPLIPIPESVTRLTGISADRPAPDYIIKFIGITMRTWASAYMAFIFYLMWHEKDASRPLNKKRDVPSVYLWFKRLMIRFAGNRYFGYLGHVYVPVLISSHMAIVHLWSISHQPAVFSVSDALMRASYLLIVSIVGGLLVHLIFEAPILNFARLCLKQGENTVKIDEIQKKVN